GEKGYVAQSLLALGELSIEEGRSAEAEPLVREALAEFEHEKATHNQARAWSAFAAAHLAGRRMTEAQHAVDSATRLLKDTDQGLQLAWLGILTARFDAERLEASAAIRRLNSVERSARAGGWVALEFEARLALADVEQRFGSPQAAEAQRKALAAEAEAKGF